MIFVTNKSNAKMMTQFWKGSDALATYVGKEFGGTSGPLEAKAIRTRKEPLENKPDTPEGLAATPGSVDMIKWKRYHLKNGRRKKRTGRNKPTHAFLTSSGRILPTPCGPPSSPMWHFLAKIDSKRSHSWIAFPVECLVSVKKCL